LIVLRPDCPVPPHRHPNVDSLDLHLTGRDRAVIGGREVPDATHRGHPFARRVPVPAGVLHSGVSFTGTAYLSMQRWRAGPPTFITDDWEGAPWV
jgi:hypothetical protein